MIRGAFIPFTGDQLNYLTSHTGTLHFRKKCIGDGFVLIHVYPIYHQGWEMDEWGAIGQKDGKLYILETNHGSLRTEEIISYSFQSTPNLVFEKL